MVETRYAVYLMDLSDCFRSRPSQNQILRQRFESCQTPARALAVDCSKLESGCGSPHQFLQRAEYRSWSATFRCGYRGRQWFGG
jgi:hypothetical protein